MCSIQRFCGPFTSLVFEPAFRSLPTAAYVAAYPLLYTTALRIHGLPCTRTPTLFYIDASICAFLSLYMSIFTYDPLTAALLSARTFQAVHYLHPFQILVLITTYYQLWPRTGTTPSKRSIMTKERGRGARLTMPSYLPPLSCRLAAPFRCSTSSHARPVLPAPFANVPIAWIRNLEHIFLLWSTLRVYYPCSYSSR